MPVVTFIDGRSQTFPQSVPVSEIARTIGTSLAKAALAAEVDGRLVDLSTLIEQDVHRL